MIRLVLRIAFWAALATYVLPGTWKGLVADSLDANAIAVGVSANASDVLVLCAGDVLVCNRQAPAHDGVMERMKIVLLSAYHGIRTQYDEPDNDTKTSSIGRGGGASSAE